MEAYGVIPRAAYSPEYNASQRRTARVIERWLKVRDLCPELRGAMRVWPYLPRDVDDYLLQVLQAPSIRLPDSLYSAADDRHFILRLAHCVTYGLPGPKDEKLRHHLIVGRNFSDSGCYLDGSPEFARFLDCLYVATLIREDA